jgi:Leucine-rich repeat (LRR) protein
LILLLDFILLVFDFLGINIYGSMQTTLCFFTSYPSTFSTYSFESTIFAANRSITLQCKWVHRQIKVFGKFYSFQLINVYDGVKFSPQQVRSLCLGYQAISDAGLAKLGECENLRWLDLAATQVTDAGLKTLADLKRLDQLNLEQTQIGDDTLRLLAKHTQLTELDLSHSKITDAGLAHLGKLANLRVLWLTGTSISDASLPTLLKFKKLETLELEETQLTPAAIQKLRAALPALAPSP